MREAHTIRLDYNVKPLPTAGNGDGWALVERLGSHLVKVCATSTDLRSLKTQGEAQAVTYGATFGSNLRPSDEGWYLALADDYAEDLADDNQEDY